MAKRRQVGGMQEVFVRTSAKTKTGFERAVKAIEKAGGRLRHAYPPMVMVAEVPSAAVTKLAGKSGIESVDTGAINQRSRAANTNNQMVMAVAAWNEHVSVEGRLRELASPELGKPWDTPDRLPPHPPEDIMEEFRRREAALLPKRARAPRDGAPNLNIPVLVDRIGVGVVFVDSTVPQFAITNQEKSKIVSEIAAGLNMLSGFEPKANIQWFYDFKRPKISLTAAQFPAANQNAWEDTWRNAALATLGFSANINGMNTYINQVKAANNAQWAYAIFVTKYPIVWFAYEWGNHVVMDFGVDGWGIDNFDRVVAHETGHVFGCPDEYASSGCNDAGLFGRYQIPNGNCENGPEPVVPCLMRANTPAMCDNTRGHLGWNELAIQSKGTTTLKGTWTFDFDSGVQGPAGGADVWWEQVDNTVRFLAPQSGATLFHMGKPNFDAVSHQTLKALAYTANPINGSNNASNQLTAGSVIAVKTSAGRYAKLKIESYGYNLGIRWVTYK